jgi:hypothetical protein
MSRGTRTALLLVLLSSASHPPAAGQTHLWSESFGGILHVGARAIAVDGSDNVLVAGLFQRTANFGGAALTARGTGDVFVAKYNAGGGHVWSKQLGGDGLERARGMAVDTNGEVFVTGFFQRTVVFGGGPLASAGLGDIFLAKYDAAGNHIWSKRFGGGGSDTGISVAVDGSGNVILTGEFQQTADFGGGPVTSAGSWDVFVVALDADGNHLWSRFFGDTDADRGWGVAADGAGNVVVTGEYRRSANFGGGALWSLGLNDIFVAKYTASGDHVWARSYGQGGEDRGLDIAVDGSSNILLTGRTASGNFGGGIVTPWGLFVVKLAGDGKHIWSRGFHGNLDFPAIAVDGIGNVVVSGDIQTTVDFGGGPLSGTLTVDIFVARFDPIPTAITSGAGALAIRALIAAVASQQLRAGTST